MSCGASARLHRPSPTHTCLPSRASLPHVQPRRIPSLCSTTHHAGCSNRNFLPVWCCGSTTMATWSNSKSMFWYSHLFSRMMRRSTEPKHVRERRARRTEGCHPRFLSHCCRVPVPRQVHVGRGCRAKSLPGCVRDDTWWREDLYQIDLR